ncbi:response regulator [Aquimarina hainanensis]|uniref:histidine kinase n=1 Tax=Aquimarina hainanensis TaxID=1578017 RepID=A0ABW5NDW3_9FLAO
MKLYRFFIRSFLIIISSSLSGQTTTKEQLNKVSKKAFMLMQQDAYYESFTLLDSVIAIAQRKHFKDIEANTYNRYGLAYVQLNHFKKAEEFYLKAMKINDSLSHTKMLCDNLVNLAHAYMLQKNYKKLDSFFPIVKQKVADLKRPEIFFNYETEIMASFNRERFDHVIEVARKALKEITFQEYQSFFTGDDYKKILKKRFTVTYRLYLGFSLMETKKNVQEAYHLLTALQKENLEKILWFSPRVFKNKSRLYYYKSKYFTDNQDSVAYYTSKSRENNLIAINMLEEKTSSHSKYIIEKIKTEKKIEQVKLLSDKEKNQKETAKVISILSVLIGILSVICAYYFYISGKYRKEKNVALREKNKRLMALDTQRTRFFSVVSHELRTPIYALTGLTEMLKNEKNATMAKKHISAIEFSGNQLLSIAENVLQYTKLKVDSISLEKNTVDIARVIETLCHSLSSEAARRKVTMHTDFSDIQEPLVVIDKRVIVQIMYNLVTNAIRFSEKGNVWVSVEGYKSDEENKTILHFIIKDDGVGIPYEKQEDIFKDYRTTGGAIDPKKGIGLGLQIVKRLLRLYNSEVNLISEEGKGATFSFFLTLEKGKEENIENPISFYKERLANKRILNVDDNQLNLLITSKVLKDIKVECDVVDNGDAAISLVKKNNYNLILMDVNMPGKDGNETTKEIRKFNSTIPIIALTAVDLKEVQETVYSSGMNDIITKPYNTEQFYEKICDYIIKAEEG